jgi:hypothetical protein
MMSPYQLFYPSTDPVAIGHQANGGDPVDRARRLCGSRR